jgi:transcription antitermination factor NusG
MTAHWYAMHVKPHKERAVYQLLVADDVEVFFPSLKVKPVNPRSAKERAYFPGYLFIRTDLAKVGTDAYRWLPGAHGLVKVGGETAVVQGTLIDEIKAHLQTIQVTGGLNLAEIQRGDRVHITEGPFAGYDGIFDAYLPGNQRVQVLLAFLSRHPQPIKLDSSAIHKQK